MNEENKRLPRCPARDEFAIIAMQERELQKERVRRERAENETRFVSSMGGLISLSIASYTVLIIIQKSNISPETARAYGLFFLGIGVVQLGTAMLMSAIRSAIRVIKENRRKEVSDNV